MNKTLCESCNHKEVCSHKDDYLNMITSLEETFNQNKRNFMSLNDPIVRCKFHFPDKGGNV